MENTYAYELTDLPQKRTLLAMKSMRATNLRKSLYNTLETIRADREPVEIVLGGKTIAVLMPSPSLDAKRSKPLINLDAVAAFCKKYQLKSFALFGSILRDDFDEKSDVDVIVEPVPTDRFISFHDECRMIDELEVLFGRKVEMLEKKSLATIQQPDVRHEIETTAKVIYDAQAHKLLR